MKRCVCVVTMICLLMGLCVLPLAAADGDVTVRYGAEDLALTLIDPLDDAEAAFDGSYGFGRAVIRDGKMTVSVSGQYFDGYNMVTEALPHASFAGARYLALSLVNESDGDIYFGLQPTVTEGGSNMFLSGELAKQNPVKLVSGDGKVQDARWSGTRAINGRDCFLVPYKFSGYVLIPLGIVADLNNLSTPVMAEDGGLVSYGFHVMADDAVTVQVTLNDVYVCGVLPEYREPAEETTTALTEEQTSATEPESATTTAIEPEQTDPDTATDTKAAATGTDIDAGSASTSATETEARDTTDAAETSGCGSAIGLSALCLVTLIGSAAFVLGKHHG